CIFTDFLFIFSPLLPHIIDTMFSVNESQLQPSLKIVTEYFIDQEKYFYLIILHANVALFIGSLTMLATGTMLLTYMQHVCGMLKIARIVQIFESSFNTTFFVMILNGLVFASLNLYRVKHLLAQLQNVYNKLQDEYENDIMEKYGYTGKCYTAALIMLFIFTDILFIFSPFLPYIIDTMYCGNKSQLQPSLKIVTEYFIDQETYFYLIILHADVAFFIGSLAMLATGAMLLTYMQHVCGMLKIARIVQIFISSFNTTFFIMILNGTVFASLNLYRVRQLVLQLIYISVLYMYIFLSNYTAQDITDHNEYIFATVYNVEWYVAPLHIQKMILFLLQKGTKAFHLILGGIFIASMESAATVRDIYKAFVSREYYCLIENNNIHSHSKF
ncbi:hypothetical protein ALC53_09489, partial [Atta colombica]